MASQQQRLGLGRHIYQYFIDRGLAPHQAAAIAGNMAWEGGGGIHHVNAGDNWKNSPNSPHSVGIGQWNDRAPSLLALARAQGIEIPEGDLRDPDYMRDAIKRIPLKTQLDFAWGEMQGPESYAYNKISSAPDLRTATAGAIGYHRPAGYTRSNPYAGHAFAERESLANQILAGSSDGESQPSPSLDPMQSTAAKGNPENKMVDLFSMLAKFGAGGKIPGVEALNDPEAANKGLFGSLSAFGAGGGSAEQGQMAGQDNNLAMQAMKQADGEEDPQQQMVRKPFDMAQLQTILQRAGRLGTLPRMGGGLA